MATEKNQAQKIDKDVGMMILYDLIHTWAGQVNAKR